MVTIALPIEARELDNTFLDKVQVTHNDMFIFPSDEEISGGDLLAVIDYHRLHIRPKYLRDRRYFEGRHDILNRPPKAAYKPDNRLIINFPKKAVTLFNGFFIGTPVKIDSPDDTTDKTITNWENINNFEDICSEVSKDSSVYGRAYFYVYQDENGQPCVINCDPLNTFIIHDDTMAHRPKYGVQYVYDNQGIMHVSLIDAKVNRTLLMNGSSANYFDQAAAVANPYPIEPIIEVAENDERMGMCEDIFSLFDALDKAMSEKANDVDYFADAYLKIINATVSKEARKEMRDNRIINAIGDDASSVDVDFLAKPDADETQEHLVDRLVDYIYQIANVTNMNDEEFAGNPSGVTLKLKYQPMKDMADTKALKFKKALRDVFQCIFSVIEKTDADAWQQLEFKFTQSVPQNLLEEAQAVSYLYGKISKKTLYSQLPFIDDPDEEIKQMRAEQQADQQQTGNLVQQYLTDQQKNGGDTNANSKPATSPDSSVDQSGQPNRSTNG